MHWFLRGLLNEWGLELQHLNPTRVLHVAGFVTVCMTFLVMEPHVDLEDGSLGERCALEGELD